jgi:hypothetical protein
MSAPLASLVILSTLSGLKAATVLIIITIAAESYNKDPSLVNAVVSHEEKSGRLLLQALYYVAMDGQRCIF